jgi:DNA-binding CsgD family transcriptional regulator/PAS domain-containing protein
VRLALSVGLSAPAVAQLQAALETLLSPFDVGGIGAWRTRVRHTLQTLLCADSSVSLLQLPGEPPFEADNLSPLIEYGAYYHRFDRVDKYRDLGTVAFVWRVIGHLWERPSRDAWLASEFYNDWVLRCRLCQPRGLNVALPPGQPLTGPPQGQDVAALYFYQDAERPAVDGERQLAILRALLPAFSTGTYLALHMGARGLLTELVGTLAEGVVLLDEHRRVAYENPAFRRLVAEDPDARQLERATAELGTAVLAVVQRRRSKTCPTEPPVPGTRTIATGPAAYRLRCACVHAGVLGPAVMALVAVERTTPGWGAFQRLRARFGLTSRELGVARLLAEGRSNEEAARLLGVSIHTARRHVEHVLLKLGVHSRAAVGARLREAEGSG